MSAKPSSAEPKPWSIKRGKDARVVVDITIDEATRARAEEEGLNVLRADVEVKGFRPGQAPINVVREKVSDKALLDATIRAAVGPMLPQIIDSEGVKPIIAPQISITAVSPLQIRIVFIEEPAASVKGLSRKAYEKKERPVDEKDVERVIANLLKESASEQTVDRPAKDGDAVIADFWAEEKDGKEVSGARAEGYRIDIGSKTLIPGFEEGLIGVRAGDKKDLTLTFPEKYQAEHLRGKPATFHITVKEVREVKMPELTAELIETRTGTRQEPDAFRKDIRERMQQQEEMVERQRREEALLDAIEKATKIELPQELVDAETQAMIAHAGEMLQAQNTTLEDWLKWRKSTPEDYIRESRERAQKRLTLRFGIAALLQEHSIEATPEEIQQRHDEMHAHGHAHDESHSEESLAWEVKVKKLIDKLLHE